MIVGKVDLKYFEKGGKDSMQMYLCQKVEPIFSEEKSPRSWNSEYLLKVPYGSQFIDVFLGTNGKDWGFIELGVAFQKCHNSDIFNYRSRIGVATSDGNYLKGVYYFFWVDYSGNVFLEIVTAGEYDIDALEFVLDDFVGDVGDL